MSNLFTTEWYLKRTRAEKLGSAYVPAREVSATERPNTRSREPRKVPASTPEIIPTLPIIFAEWLASYSIPMPEPEFRFNPDRKWRFDYAWPASKVALEVEGGVWTEGRHTRGKGFLADIEKYNCAACRGWRILRCTPDTLTVHKTAISLLACLCSPLRQDYQP